MRTVRLFVSSPGDVEFERQRVERVAERLNGELWPHVCFATVRWETKFYSAHKSFQEHIPEAAECDIVIAVFWSRLGTELSDRLAAKFHMANGKPYPSGTAYEVMTAIEARKTADHPDVYVFRKTEVPTVPLNDMAQRIEAERQWQRLEDFFAHSFRAPDGSFLAAHHEFKTTDEFEEHVEKLLLDWLDERFLRGKAITWPIETKGSPFRGLAPFDAKHAPVFFGRMRKVMRAVDHLKDAARRSFDAPERPEADLAERRLKPFLLIVGPSGAGKSSLMRAGLAPRITAPGVVPEIDHWRTAIMRPGDGGSPFDALVRALLVTGKGDDPGGFGRALSEVCDGDKLTSEALVELFRTGAPAAALVVAALDRAATDVRKSGGFERAVRADLLLLVDQLEDIFAANINDTQRSDFAHLLSALSATKRVWVVATLRGDLYNRLIKDRAFLALKDAGHTYDLAPPGPDELGEIIQRSAEAAGLVYDSDPATGERLDDRLLKDAEGKDILPLLQFTLDRLFEERKVVGEETRLTFASYRAMGGLDGAINQSAERAIRKLGDAEVAALPRLLRSLAVTVRENAGTTGTAELTVRAAPLDEAVTDDATRRLVNALLEARIVLTSRAEPEQPEGKRSDSPADETAKPADNPETEGAGVLRIAHQRVFECWERARKIIHDHRDYFRMRNVVEDQRRRWQAAGQRADLLVPDGRALEEAELLVTRYGDELPPVTRTFVAQSVVRARRNQTIRRTMRAALVVVAVVATGTSIAAWYWGNRAVANYEAARGTVDNLISSINVRLRNIDRISVFAIDEALKTVSALVENLESASGGDPLLKRTRAAMRYEFAETFKAADDPERALKEATESLRIRDELVKLRRSELEWLWDYTLSLDQVGDVQRLKRAVDDSRKNYEVSYAIRQDLHRDQSANPKWKHGLSLSLVRIGDLKLKPHNAQDDIEAARAAYQQALDLSIEVFKSNTDEVKWQRELSWDFNKVGDVRALEKKYQGALEAFGNSLCTRRYMSSQEPNNSLWKRDVAFTLDRIAEAKRRSEDFAGAEEALSEALFIRRRLSDSDASHTLWLRELAGGLNRLGDLKFQTNRPDLAAGLFMSAIDILTGVAQRAPELVPVGLQLGNSRAGFSNAIARLRANADAIVPADQALLKLGADEVASIMRRLGAPQDHNPLICWGALKASLGVPVEARQTTNAPR